MPGSKNTRADLDWLRQQGWEQAIAKHLRYGGKLLGICGGFQMLGTTIEDPLGLEDQAGTSSGLNYLEMNTLLKNEKRLARVSGKLILDDAEVIGYEIHLGESTGPALQRPLVKLAQGTDGAISMDGQIMGTYLHGIFDHPAALTALLSWAGLQQATHHDLAALRNQELDRVAASLSQHCQPLDWLEWR